jgi:hypothetical protein
MCGMTSIVVVQPLAEVVVDIAVLKVVEEAVSDRGGFVLPSWAQDGQRPPSLVKRAPLIVPRQALKAERQSSRPAGL